ncbi:hypothetical protein GCM10010424_43020 [Streptomyces lienomycini]
MEAVLPSAAKVTEIMASEGTSVQGVPLSMPRELHLRAAETVNHPPAGAPRNPLATPS